MQQKEKAGAHPHLGFKCRVQRFVGDAQAARISLDIFKLGLQLAEVAIGNAVLESKRGRREQDEYNDPVSVIPSQHFLSYTMIRSYFSVYSDE